LIFRPKPRKIKGIKTQQRRIQLGSEESVFKQESGQLTDEVLILNLAGGDKRALDEIMNRYRRKALSYAYRYLGNFDDAEDAAQDSFVKVYHFAGRFDNRSSFAGWFYSILINCCRDRLRQKKRFGLFTKRFEKEMPSANPGPEYELGEQAKALQVALQKLSPDKREILTLRLSHEQSYEDMSKTLGISIGTVMSRLFRAKKELEKLLMEMGAIK
jgi:RNA polymerase sigma-70 factor, ECF subfamily